jgi:uncharacterized protein
MGVDESLLKEVVRRILAVANPDRIILFGSAATGAMTPDSDIDLLVVAPETGNRHEETVEIRAAIGDLPYAVDVLLMTTDRFEATKNLMGGVAYPAHRYGRVLYETLSPTPSPDREGGGINGSSIPLVRNRSWQQPEAGLRNLAEE